MRARHTPDAEQRMDIDGELLSFLEGQVKIIKGKDCCTSVETIPKH
jgi:hypothetical protein